MKKSVVSTSIFAVFALAAFSAQAASTGTITFNGELTDTTCEVDINGQGSDATVILPTVGVNQLTASGDTTGRTSFNMNISDCVIGTEGGHSKVAAFFQPGNTVDLSTGRSRMPRPRQVPSPAASFITCSTSNQEYQGETLPLSQGAPNETFISHPNTLNGSLPRCGGNVMVIPGQRYR